MLAVPWKPELTVGDAVTELGSLIESRMMGS